MNEIQPDFKDKIIERLEQEVEAANKLRRFWEAEFLEAMAHNTGLETVVKSYNDNYDYYKHELAGSWKEIREKAENAL